MNATAMPPPLFTKVPSVAKLERGRSRGVSVDVSSPRTPLGKFMKKVTSRGAFAGRLAVAAALHLELRSRTAWRSTAPT